MYAEAHADKINEKARAEANVGPVGWAYPRSVKMLELVDKNKEWIFSGVGITVLALIVLFSRKVFTWLVLEGPRVGTSIALTGTPIRGLIKFLSIIVENHTEKPLYIDNIFLELDTGEQFVPRFDPLTGEGQIRRQIMPGSSFTFHIAASDIVGSGLPQDCFRCAAVRDAVGRVYRSSGRRLQKVLRAICRP